MKKKFQNKNEEEQGINENTVMTKTIQLTLYHMEMQRVPQLGIPTLSCMVGIRREKYFT